MIRVKFDFFSQTLKRDSTVNLLLPQQRGDGEPFEPPYPVLYLLHGLGENQDSWMHRYSIENLLYDRNMAVVMPYTGRGFYTDTTYGARQYSFIAEELPEILGKHFPLSKERKDTYAAGLSMGGYGALKLALRNPERFYAAISLSGAPIGNVMLKNWKEEHTNEVFINEMKAVFGEPISPEDDVFALLEAGAQKAQKPRLFLCCGEKDGLFPLNQVFLHLAEKSRYYVYWTQDPAAGHDLAYWNRMMAAALDWLDGEG